ncbi:MAG TPA: acetoacetate decarboxylase family protein [Solirubrobacteraceae bacterium]|nr:acetoacetate decarboxylase family protein [Solirubrobacteraceae bacterium]
MSRQSAFFEGVAQVEATLAGEPARLPIFYYDGTAQTAVFAARLGGLRALMPDPRFAPARLCPGIGAVAVSCFEYRDTDIGPYNELAISIVLNDPPFSSNLPGRAVAAGIRRRQLHAWVHHLPVTTEIARAGGVELYNYPKFIAAIDFDRTGELSTCRLAEGDEHILTLSGARIPAPRADQVQLFSHLWMDRQPQSSEFKINALESGRSPRPGAARLALGSRHPIALELDSLLLSRRSIYYESFEKFEGILYGPEHLTLPLVQRALALTEAGEPTVR